MYNHTTFYMHAQSIVREAKQHAKTKRPRAPDELFDLAALPDLVRKEIEKWESIAKPVGALMCWACSAIGGL